MKKHTTPILLLLFSISHLLCFSQNRTIDSLLVRLKTEKIDTNKLSVYNDLCTAYCIIGVYDSALFYSNTGLKLSRSILKANPNSKVSLVTYKRQASAYNNAGNTYYYQSNYMEALKHYFKSLYIRKALGDRKAIADSYSNIGAVYFEQGNYPQAFESCLLALKIREEDGDKAGIAESYNNIGNIYYEQKNHAEALKNHFACLKIVEELGDKSIIATVYNNIGLVYCEQRNYTEALKSHFNSLNIKKELGDQKGLADSYNNIGNVYFDQKKYQEALKEYFAALKIVETLNNPSNIALYCGNIGNVYTQLGDYKEADRYLTKSKNISREIGDKACLKAAYVGLTKLDSTRGNYKGAFENHQLFILYRDSLDNEETREKTIQSRMNYDFEKKEAIANAEHKKELENQSALSQEKNRKQNLLISFVFVVLLIVLVFAGFIFRSLRLTRSQKNIIEQQKLFVDEKQKEILDSITYAKRIQEAILPSITFWEEHLPDSFIVYKPKDIVAGDFYWMEVIKKKDENIVLYAAADCTGHGVPGALVSVVCSNALNTGVKEYGAIDPGKLLNKTRELVTEKFEKSGNEINDGMDISLCTLNIQTKELLWAGANNSLIIISDGVLREIKPNKMPIGKYLSSESFTTHKVQLNSGDLIYVFTDGYADQFGGKDGKKFKYKRLKELLLSISHESIEKQKQLLDKTFDEWKGNLEQIDDVCIIGVRI